MFTDKVVLVTGASSGIGEATAKLFAKNGAKLTLVGRNKDNLENCAKICSKEAGVQAQTIIADLSSEEQARTVIPKTIEHWGRLDVLVNNAGKVLNDSILDPDFITKFMDIVSTNLISAVILTNDAAPHLVESKGNIVNISSIAGLKPIEGHSSYCISKAALDQLTKCTAQELAPKGVRVNSVNPGPVKTNIVIKSRNISNDENEKLFNHFEQMMPLKRVSDSEEIGELIMFLASDKARGITGSVFVADCGSLLLTMSVPVQNS